MISADQISKADDFVDDAARLFLLLEEQERRIQRIFLTAIKSLKDEIDLADLSTLIAQGRIGDALARLTFAADQLAAASNIAFITAGASAAEMITSAGLGLISFDQVNLNAVAAMQRNRLALIREFTNEQRRATSQAIISGVEGGINPVAQARNFRDSIGLTRNQWRHVANYRAALERSAADAEAAYDATNRKLRDARFDANVARARRTGKPISAAKIDQMVERYADRYLKHRAKVIARTEALRAVHQGNEESYRQAIAEGVIREDQLTRTWRTSVDGRERDTHRALNGTDRAWGEAWETPNGQIKYPGDPDAPPEETIQCRCAILTRIKRN